MSITSDIPIKLPTFPLVADPDMARELLLIYDAVRLLQVEISTLKQRVLSLEQYNIAHP